MYDLSGEFDKVYSTDASDFLGGFARAKRAEEQRFAGDALSDIARLKMAKKGLTMAPGPQGYASGGSGLRDQLLGAAGDLVGGLVSKGVSGLFNQNRSYADTSTPALSSQLTSPETWNQTSQAVQGVMDGGFSWQQNPW